MGDESEVLGRFAATVLSNPWIPEDHRIPQPPTMLDTPTLPQAEFLMQESFEVLYGGAAGGGKSSALLMAALQYVEVPNYSAGIFRRTFADLSLPGALMDRARKWLANTGARWNEQSHSWRFPSGATLTFGYLQDPGDELRYQGSEFQFIGFDELTQLREEQYRYMLSRIRRGVTSGIPLRAWSATNPGGPGHDWVRQRFLVEGGTDGRKFIPARLRDNPHLDREAYEKSLRLLDPVSRARLLDGDWSVRETAGKFRRDWFQIIRREQVPADVQEWVRYWDLAATKERDERSGRKKDPDWTSGCLLGKHAGRYYLLDMRRAREEAPEVERLLLSVCAHDRTALGGVPTFIEQEPGSSGKMVISSLQRHALSGFEVYGDRPTGSKIVRAGPVASAARAGNVFLVEGPWVGPFLDEIELFPLDGHDDQVDALSGAFGKLSMGEKTPMTETAVPWL